MVNTGISNEHEVALGRQLKDLRLRQNLNQQELASRAGIALNAVKNLENGHGATVSSLVRVLRSLGRIQWLETIAPVVTIRPLQMLKTKPKRQRASKPRGSADVCTSQRD